jgi:hypothetical protein
MTGTSSDNSQQDSTCDGSGLEYEADQRQAEIIVRELGLKEESTGVVMPGVSGREEASKVRSDDGQFEEKTYRAVAARANYLAQDRAHIQFAAKEMSRFWQSQRQRTGGESKGWADI